MGCRTSDSVALKSPEKIKLSLSIKNSDCIPNGKIVVSAKSGVPPYMFSFNKDSFDTTSLFGNLSKGNYLIAVKDSNNCSVSSKAVVASTTQNCQEGDIIISPNPSSTVFTLTIGNDQISKQITINVYGDLGKLIYSVHGTQKSSYTFGNTLMKGIYFVQVELDSKVYKFKIIKE